MPHSSGGGSSGGGFHSGGSSHHGGSSGNASRISTRPFVGATSYIYYTRSFQPRVIYSSTSPDQLRKSSPAAYVFLGIFALVPVGVMLFTGIHNPAKLPTNYASTIEVIDHVDALSDEEEAALESTFNEFYTVSGISPYLLCIDNETWSSSFSSLEDYAYREYLKLFSDESHWLIVYAGKSGSPRENWHFEGMQGNDTDGILTTKVTDAFNSALYDDLRGNAYTVGGAVDHAFRSILPTLMDKSFYVEPAMIVFSCAWFGMVAFFLAAMIVNDVQRKALKGAVKATNVNPASIKTCIRCGTQYYPGSITKCPKCGTSLADDRFIDPDSDDRFR